MEDRIHAGRLSLTGLTHVFNTCRIGGRGGSLSLSLSRFRLPLHPLAECLPSSCFLLWCWRWLQVAYQCVVRMKYTCSLFQGKAKTTVLFCECHFHHRLIHRLRNRLTLKHQRGLSLRCKKLPRGPCYQGFQQV